MIWIALVWQGVCVWRERERESHMELSYVKVWGCRHTYTNM